MIRFNISCPHPPAVDFDLDVPQDAYLRWLEKAAARDAAEALKQFSVAVQVLAKAPAPLPAPPLPRLDDGKCP